MKKNNLTRGKKALINTISELMLQLVTAICGFILPGLVLTHFGSTYNGITHSITQFISCIELLKSGIGSVTRAALYKPLSKNDSNGISEIVNATDSFMKKIALIFLTFVILFSVVYPFIIKDDISWKSASSLVLILSISTFAQYFIGLTYQMVLQADQKNYIISIIQIFSTIANTLVSAILIKLGCSIHIVKFASALVFIIPPVFYYYYVKNKYQVNKKVKPNKKLISQRWSAFGHQLANFINLNTDVAIATFFLSLKEVSVYTIYHLIIFNMKKVVTSFTSGVTSAFGNMIANNEHENLRKKYKSFELLIYFISTTIFSTTAVLIIPFLGLYTKNVHDANYIRPIFAILVCLAGWISCVKLPYETIVYSSGKFKETRNAAFIEAAINMFSSIVLVNFIGLNGLMLGTIFAGMFRIIIYNRFVRKNIIIEKNNNLPKRILYSVISVCITVLLFKIIKLYNCTNYLWWIINAFISLCTIIFINILTAKSIFNKDFDVMLKNLINILKRRKERK